MKKALRLFVLELFGFGTKTLLLLPEFRSEACTEIIHLEERTDF
jgi:hypothetical protein